jgi:hypothetical protein
MSGDCQKFEVILKRIAPETEESGDTTNHTAVEQPFYPLYELEL